MQLSGFEVLFISSITLQSDENPEPHFQLVWTCLTPLELVVMLISLNLASTFDQEWSSKQTLEQYLGLPQTLLKLMEILLPALSQASCWDFILRSRNLENTALQLNTEKIICNEQILSFVISSSYPKYNRLSEWLLDFFHWVVKKTFFGGVLHSKRTTPNCSWMLTSCLAALIFWIFGDRIDSDSSRKARKMQLWLQQCRSPLSQWWWALAHRCTTQF